jgi:hypothetical protein
MPELLAQEGIPYLLVNTFTPLIGSLLLSTNPRVGDCARLGLVDLLNRLHVSAPDIDPDPRYAPVSPQVVFGDQETAMIENEIIYGVVLGMARLDAEFPEVEQTPGEQTATEHEAPARAARSSAPSPDSDRGLYQVESNDPFGFQPLRSPPRHALDTEDAAPVMELGGRGRDNTHSGSPAPELQPQQQMMHVDSEGWITMGPPMSPSPAIPEDALSMHAATPTPVTNASASSGEWALPTESDGDPMLDDASGEATVGRVASMSLVAALAANGTGLMRLGNHHPDFHLQPRCL